MKDAKHGVYVETLKKGKNHIAYDGEENITVNFLRLHTQCSLFFSKITCVPLHIIFTDIYTD